MDLAPISQNEIRSARNRPQHQRTRYPTVGDWVWYRHYEWDDPTRAQIVWVEPESDRRALLDPNVWMRVLEPDGSVFIARHPDPWPLVRISTEHGLIETREARIRGSAGWMHHWTEGR